VATRNLRQKKCPKTCFEDRNFHAWKQGLSSHFSTKIRPNFPWFSGEPIDFGFRVR